VEVYISIDMEGVAGVVHVDQTRRDGHDYERARRWMTGEANAAIVGAFDGGASAVLINDSHADMRNLILDDLDPRAEVISGSLKPHSMVQGVAAGHAAALFIGYHAGAASQAGILDHTYFGKVVARCRVGGRDWNETAINAAVCGARGVPVALVTGDATTCAQAREALGEVATVEVKQAFSRYSARSIAPSLACQRIREAAASAVRRAAAGELRPFRPALPLDLEVDFATSACADAAELVPGTTRSGGVTCGYRAADPTLMLQVLRAWTILAASTLV
jgi:D-amino peptidase